jgi:hypothetical protein
MTASLPNTRLLAIAGALLGLVALLLVARPLLMGGDDEATSSSTLPRTAPINTPPPAAAPARLKLLPGLPPSVARELRYEKVVVVSLYAAKAPSDRKALAHARVGAKKVGAGFVALNVYDERKANSLVKFIGTTDSPAIVVVRRPGTVVNRIPGFVDAEIVAQAAQNAGAKKKPAKKSAS